MRFSKDLEKFWHFTSENIPDFYMPALKKEMLVSYDKLCEGTHPKMLLYALDELFHVFRGWGENDLNGQCVVAHDILSFASLCCMEWRGKPINPCKTCGDASTMVDANAETGLKQLTWVIYDGVLLPRDPRQLQGQHDWLQIMAGTYHLMFQGEHDFDHCLPCTTASFDAKQATRKAKWQCGHTQPSAATPLPRACRVPAM